MDSLSIFEKLGSAGIDWVVSFTPSLVGAIVVALLGWVSIGWFTKWLHSFFTRVNFDEALETFIESMAGAMLKVLLLVIVVSMLGVQTTSLVAVLGAMSLAVGLALQGSLANFAGGVLILMFRPFRVGDTLATHSGYRGTVKEIQIFNTILESPTKETIVLPNGDLSNNPLVNVTSSGNMGVEFTFGIGYGDDAEKAKSIIKDVLDRHEGVLSEKGYKLGVRNLGPSSVDIFVRVLVHPNDYWDVTFEVTEEVKKTFDERGISIPFPQMDVHMRQDLKG